MAKLAKLSILDIVAEFIPTFSGVENPKRFNFSVDNPSFTLKWVLIETGNFPLASIAPKSNSAETT